MKQHRYLITVKHLADANGQPSAYDKPMQFEVGNHDDVFAVVERVKRRGDFDDTTTAAFAVGLKLFSEVMIENRGNLLFEEFSPHFFEFMKKLKKGIPPD
ncbi:hypothetical protein ALDI51_09680 [Alicycliphilus denitrificans]|jgi:hypothetical protein|uniref:DUF3861 domain-containing protein n=1 Tax=Alicycliphilus denitrificans TaxID=179636 RepID=UPI0019160308|nr:DUF3861 domain-containing protein [Alicycliphilus denitrificans]BCN37649.1 hypothetical protein ALDI51_09680 [Alicycliphilus denitrificans]